MSSLSGKNILLGIFLLGSSLIYYKDEIKKKFILNYFKQVTVIINKQLDNSKLLIKTPLIKSIKNNIIRSVFFDNLISNIPHTYVSTVSDDILKLILLNLDGNHFVVSDYKFKNEKDYICLLKETNYTLYDTLNNKSGLEIFYEMIETKIGYLLIDKINNDYIIDTTELSNYEIRSGYTNLHFKIYLKIQNNNFIVDKIINNGKTYHKNNNKFDLKIREANTAIVTLFTIREHAFKIHFLVSDKINMLIETHLSENNIIRSILNSFAIMPYVANEAATFALLGKTGFSLMSNLTQKGILNYYKDTIKKFKIRDMFNISKIKSFPNKNINNDMLLWYDCINNYVSEYLDLFVIDNETKSFMSVLEKEYSGIFLEEQTDKQNLIDICSMIIFTPVIHELYSNLKIARTFSNPYIISSSWKKNKSGKLNDKINNLSEQLRTNIMALSTLFEAIPMNSSQWVNDAPNDKKNIVKKFIKNIGELPIQIGSIIHPKEISTSISY